MDPALFQLAKSQPDFSKNTISTGFFQLKSYPNQTFANQIIIGNTVSRYAQIRSVRCNASQVAQHYWNYWKKSITSLVQVTNNIFKKNTIFLMKDPGPFIGKKMLDLVLLTTGPGIYDLGFYV